MKTRILFILLFTASASFYGDAQIRVLPFPPEIHCDIDGLADLPLPEAKSENGSVQTSFSDETVSGGCLGTIIRTVRFTDSSKSVQEVQQIIHLSDNAAPVLFGSAPDISVAKDHIPPPAVFDARDNSGQIMEVLFKEESRENQLFRIWSCEDSCGNRSEIRQVITLLPG